VNADRARLPDPMYGGESAWRMLGDPAHAMKTVKELRSDFLAAAPGRSIPENQSEELHLPVAPMQQVLLACSLHAGTRCKP